MISFSPPELLTVKHQVDEFDCGSVALNSFLHRFALQNNAAGVARTYITTPTNSSIVAGYYSLCAASVEKANVPERIGKGIPNHPVPVVLLARLAVDSKCQRMGVGKGLLKDALTRALTAAQSIGIRAVLVHAKDTDAAAFYSRYGFSPSPTDPLHLMLLVKDVQKYLR